jgi:thiol:disulfide interchange protein
MRILQRFLAIPMGLSALAALWLLNRQAGERGFLIGLALSIGLLFAAFESGRLQRKGKGGAWGGALAGLGLVVAGVALMPQRSAAVPSIAGAETWSDARVASYVAQGKSVFVYFTADWCLTCKANEAAAIDRGEVRDAFKQSGVKVLAGDWTNGDPAITRFLESRGRAGVPLYLWYAPGKAPEELPQILTPGVLISRAQQVKR